MIKFLKSMSLVIFLGFFQLKASQGDDGGIDLGALLEPVSNMCNTINGLKEDLAPALGTLNVTATDMNRTAQNLNLTAEGLNTTFNRMNATADKMNTTVKEINGTARYITSPSFLAAVAGTVILTKVFNTWLEQNNERTPDKNTLKEASSNISPTVSKPQSYFEKYKLLIGTIVGACLMLNKPILGLFGITLP